MLADVHDGDSWNLPQSSLQVSVTCGHQVAFVLLSEEEDIHRYREQDVTNRAVKERD